MVSGRCPARNGFKSHRARTTPYWEPSNYGALNSQQVGSIMMGSSVDELQEIVIELQLELRKLEAKRRRLKKKVNSELDRLLRAKEILKRNRRICV